jgi:NADH-quinone oxidoreductase subunit M
MLFTFSSIGLPGLNGFVGEFMILAGSFQRAWQGVSASLTKPYLIMALSAVVGVVLGAWYMLWAVERVFFGGSREPPRGHGHGDHHGHHGHHDDHGHGDAHDHGDHCDLRWHELAALVPLAVFVIWIGVAPQAFLRPAAPTIAENTRAARQAFTLRMESLPAPSPSQPQVVVADEPHSLYP